MRMKSLSGAVTFAALVVASWPSLAQTSADEEPGKAPESLAFYFDHGSASLRDQDEELIEQAGRLYREGNPIVMVVAGSTDATGSAEQNLRLSQRRAEAVLRALIAQGIPAERFQLVAKGETELSVATGDGVPEQRNRRVDLTWR